MKMKEGATRDKTKDLAHWLGPELLQRGPEEGEKRPVPQGRSWSQHAERSEDMPVQQQDPDKWEVEEEASAEEECGWGARGDFAD